MSKLPPKQMAHPLETASHLENCNAKANATPAAERVQEQIRTPNAVARHNRPRHISEILSQVVNEILRASEEQPPAAELVAEESL